MVDSFFCHQRPVISFFHDLVAGKHQDPVRAVNRRQPMGNGERRPARRQLLQ